MKKTFFAFLALFLALGCGPSSRITHSWSAGTAQFRPWQRIMVAGIIRQQDRALREQMEQHLVADLRARGYEAVCACEEYGPKALDGLNEQQVLDKLKQAGVDAVLTVVLLDKTQERYYVPGRVRYTPYMVYHNRFWYYSRTVYDRIYTEGYYRLDTRYFWESNLYDLTANDQLVYSAQSESFDPASTETMAREYAQMLVKDMVGRGVLRGQAPAATRPM